ncbi:MAG: prepilin-type N-terminal cleavage/methylation domain-containing protein [Clostridiales bacterium]|nr:prepilin-type N-terminal cleavage/methylation domain-containing protein [Clostridiales bacterium]
MMKNKSGITLVELLIAIAIFVTLVGLMGVFFATGLNSYRTNSEMLTSQGNVRAVMFELSSKLREASIDDIEINGQHSSIDIDGTLYAFSLADSTISRTQSENTVVIARNISHFRVEVVNEITIVYNVESTNDNINLNSSVTLREFDRPSPAN